MKTIFITGVSGFVGSNLVRYLQDKADIKIIGHTRDIVSARKKFKDYKLELVTDIDAEAWDRMGVDCVIHLAGIAHDLSGKFHAPDYESINYRMTADLFENFVKSKATSFMFLSSIKAAVDVSSFPASEEVQSSPVTEYGKSKRKAEVYIENAKCPEGKIFYIFRPCLIYGQGNKGNLKLLYQFVQRGWPYPLGAFQNQRSLLFVENLNFVFDHFLRNPCDSGIYHLSDSGSLSTLELVGLIAGLLKKKVSILRIPSGLCFINLN